MLQKLQEQHYRASLYCRLTALMWVPGHTSLYHSVLSQHTVRVQYDAVGERSNTELHSQQTLLGVTADSHTNLHIVSTLERNKETHVLIFLNSVLFLFFKKELYWNKKLLIWKILLKNKIFWNTYEKMYCVKEFLD